MNLELFHKEFHSIILQLVYNNLLRLSVALNISYSPQQSCEMELQNNRVLTYEGCFGFHRVANAKESRLSARPEPTRHKYARRYVALNV